MTMTTSVSKKLDENANESSSRYESVHTPNRTSQNERSDKIVYTQPHCSYSQGIDERYINSLYVQNGVSCRDSSVPSNGLRTSRVAPRWALSNNFMQWAERGLVTRNTVQDSHDSHRKEINTTKITDLSSIYHRKLLPTARNDGIVNSRILTGAVNESLSGEAEKSRKNRKNSVDKEGGKRFDEETTYKLLDIVGVTTSACRSAERKTKISPEPQRKTCYHDVTDISISNCASESPHNSTSNCASKVEQREEAQHHCATSVSDNEPLNLIINSNESHDKTEVRLHEHRSVIDKDIEKQTDRFLNKIHCYYTAKYKNYGLLKFSDLDEKLYQNLDLFKIDKLRAGGDEINKKLVTNNLKQEWSQDILDKYVTHVLSSPLSDAKDTELSTEHLWSNVKCYNNIKKECGTEEEAHKSENGDLVAAYYPRLSNWEYPEMSGQYPGHSRPPVGTPPPQTVWNHLTMTQGQVSGLNIHPTALSGAALNPAAFYTHQSMARASHLTSQLTPQLAHTQAPPTWHTPTVPSKSVTPANTPGNPLFSLQMLVDNRQNQNQYRNSPGSQSTLDLSSTSEIIPENYSRLPQDIPISLTARNVDKGSRNGNIISPPIPLNGETSSDSGISSSVPTPNSVSEPVSLSTKEVTTPKITVKNFESNLKGVANLHDKIKEMNVENFTQKINLPPSVTIERVIAEKKEPEVTKAKDTLSVIAQVPRNVLPVIVNLTSKEKDVTDSPKRESSSEREKKLDETSVRSPKSLPKRGKKGVDSLLEKLEGGNKKLGSTENIGSVIVMPVEEKDSSSVKSMSPERQKSRSPNREDEVVSPAFSNDDSNDNIKQQRRKRKLEKPVRLSKDSKTEVEDMELEPTEPSEPRIVESAISEETSSCLPTAIPGLNKSEEQQQQQQQQQPVVRADERISHEKADEENTEEEERSEENQPIRRRRSSEGTAGNSINPTNQRVRRKSSDDASEFTKSATSPKNNASNSASNPFNEVESELEKMFAGIVEPDSDVKKEESKAELANAEIQGDGAGGKLEGLENSILPTTSSHPNANPIDVSSTIDAKMSGKKGKKGKMQGRKRKLSRSSENIFGTTSEPTAKDAKRKRTSKGSKKQEQSKKAKRNTKIDGLREMAYDSGSNASSIRSRGPVVHVEGPRDSPLSIQVVNAPREEEEEKSKEKRKSVGNGNAGRSKRLSHQNDLDYRGKVNKAGLFSSTLSSRYDAHTPDSTWVCVFCKQGPHSVIPGDPSRPHPNLAGPHIATGTYTVPAGVLGDLFGPYLIGKERLEDGILSADEQEITREQKKGGKNKRSLRYAGLADQFSAKMGKKKRTSVESNTNAIFTGMIMLPGEEQRWEVWLHEQCAIWAAGVYMAGGRVTGLQEAVWDAAKSICCSCGLTGANIGCVMRGCKAVSHYPCALTKGWHLDTNQYIPKCSLHRVT